MQYIIQRCLISLESVKVRPILYGLAVRAEVSKHDLSVIKGLRIDSSLKMRNKHEICDPNRSNSGFSLIILISTERNLKINTRS